MCTVYNKYVERVLGGDIAVSSACNGSVPLTVEHRFRASCNFSSSSDDFQNHTFK